MSEARPAGPDAPVVVRHSRGVCCVHVGAGALGRIAALLPDSLAAAPKVIITDETVAGLYGAPAMAGLGGSPPLVPFPPGERHKTRDTWAILTDRLLALGLGRDGVIVALGGGVVGDMAGFVAATYLRGVPVVQVPTTLLAMVDAAVGGKVAVDTPAGKNLVGAFHQPAAVIADPLVLATLPERDYRGGLAEAVKHGLMLDDEYLGWIESSAGALVARDSAAVTHLVRRSVELKAGVVARDEHDHGIRAALNAGHTVGHAIEHATGYAVSHGDAVAIGLVTEAEHAAAAGLVPPTTPARLRQLLDALGLPTTAAAAGVDLPPDALIRATEHDKKRRAGDDDWWDAAARAWSNRAAPRGHRGSA